jgi:MFS family permease
MTDDKTRLFSRDFILVMTATMGTSFVTFFFFSTLPLFADMLTGTAAFTGYLSLAYSATALVARPLCGILADKRGRVKILILGAAFSTVSCFLYVVTTNLSVYNLTAALALLLAIRVLNGAGMGFNLTSAGAAVADIVPKERLAEGIGLFGIAGTLAQAIGPLIALAIVASGELSSFNTLFYVSAAFCGVSFISGCFVKYERERFKVRPAKRGLGAAQEPDNSEAANVQAPDEPDDKAFFGFDRKVLSPAVLTVLYFFGISGVFTFLTLFGKVRGFQVENIGWFFFTSAGGIMLSRLVLGRVVDRRGPDIVVIPGITIVALCLFLIPLAPSLPLLVCLGLPYGLANGAVGPNIQATMFKRCSPKRRGTVSAAYSMAIDVGITLGAPVLGKVADLADFTWVYWLSAASVVVALFVYIFFVSERMYRKRHG